MKKRIVMSAAAVMLMLAPLEAGKNVAPVATPVVPVAVPLGFYVGAGLLGSFFGRDCPCGDGSRIYDHTYGIAARAGYNWNSYLGIEGQAHWAPLEEDFMKMSNIGLYLKPQLPLGDRFSLYGLLGYGLTHYSCDCPGHPHHTHNVHGFQYGAGVEYFFDDTNVNGRHEGWSVWGGYLNLMHNKEHYNFTDNVWSLGIGYHF